MRRFVPTSSLGLASRALSLPFRRRLTAGVAGTPSPSPVFPPAKPRPRGIPPVATTVPAPQWASWLTAIARTVNLMLGGKMNATAAFTLTPSATSTVFTDSRIGKFSHVTLEPATATAAAARPSIFIVPGNGFATIYHPSAPDGDQTFSALIIG